MSLFRNATAALVAAASCLASGCSSDSSSPSSTVEVVGTGTLTLDWTIDGLADPNECDQGDARDIDVVVTTVGGAFVGEYTAPCRDFVTRIELTPGSYAANAALLDGAGQDRTTAVNVDVFDILGDDDLSVSIDFPADSFY